MKVKKFFLLATMLLMSMCIFAQKDEEGAASSWKNIVVNSDLEGNDMSCFLITENIAEDDATLPATVINGAGMDNSRGIVAQSVDNPADTWNTQFFVRLPMALPVGTKYRMSFDYKASQDAQISMEVHGEPHEYINWYFDWGSGDMVFTSSWQHFECEGIVSQEMNTDENMMRTIAFDLAYEPSATLYYFDNIVFEIDQAQLEEPSVAIITGNMPYGDDAPEVVVRKNKTVTLKALVCPLTLEDQSVTWKSSDKTIATVSSAGVVKGVKTGVVTITCTSNATGMSATCKVTVGTITLNKSSVTIDKGNTVTLKPTVYPTTLEDQSVTWESSDESIATVTSAGKVKGVKAGTTTITCTSNATGLSTTCIVTVNMDVDDVSPWKNIVVNSDLEDDDMSCFLITENVVEDDAVLPATVIDGAGVGNSRGIVVKSVDDPVNTYDTQFFVRLPIALPVGTKYRMSFDYKASQDAYVKMEVHGEPHEYLDWSFDWGYGDMNCTSSWQHFECEGIVTEQMSHEDNMMRSIAFDLANESSAALYYFDNIVFEIDQAQLEEPSVAITADNMTYGDDAPEVVVRKNKTVALEAFVCPLTLEDKSVKWKSSDKTIATVSSAGVVKGVKTGTVTITCTSVATGAKATCKVTVGTITLNISGATVNQGNTVTLKPTVYPTTLEDKSVTWESSDESIATVTSDGIVTGVKPGVATITCTSNATGLSTTCTVTVSGVVLDQSEVILRKKKTVTLTPTFYPETQEDKSVTWKSSDKTIATVTSTGKVTGVKTGVVTITCTSNATGQSTTCKVTVGTITLDQSEVVVRKKKTVTLTPTVYPTTLEDKSVTWESSDESVATVSSDGVVTGVLSGVVTITCTSNATGLSATCKVTIGTITLSKSSATITVGETLKLKPTVYPTTLEDQSVTWKSSNKAVAKVSSTGKVTALKAGTATITCTSNATGLSTTCKITVKASASARTLDEEDAELTDIEIAETPAVEEPFDVYDLRGHRVLQRVTSLDGLPAGVYIVNGKKVTKK